MLDKSKLIIKKIFKQSKKKLIEQKYKTTRLTEYEKAFGFTEDTRKGSKPFANTMGYIMEKIWLSTPYFKVAKSLEKGLDGESDNILYQFKNRHDTMKGSQAYNEILPMLIKAINKKKKFYLVIVVDKNNISKNIPLHLSYGLSKIKDIKGYDMDNHRYISDNFAYSHFFPKNGIEIIRNIS